MTNLSFDHEADALYLLLSEARVAETEQVAPGIILDFDKDDRVVGIEVLYVSKRASESDKIPLAVESEPAAG